MFYFFSEIKNIFIKKYELSNGFKFCVLSILSVLLFIISLFSATQVLIISPIPLSLILNWLNKYSTYRLFILSSNNTICFIKFNKKKKQQYLDLINFVRYKIFILEIRTKNKQNL
jgi:hypothetical protein